MTAAKCKENLGIKYSIIYDDTFLGEGRGLLLWFNRKMKKREDVAP
jgi:hypothetical protein